MKWGSERSCRPTTMLVSFFLPALILLAIAGVLALANGIWGIGWGRWPILHLAMLGGVSQLVVGAAQFFVAAFLATAPPRRGLVALQVTAWNAGALMVASSRVLGSPGIAEAGAALILLGILAFAAGLLEMKQRSLQRYAWATRWYLAAAAFLSMGVIEGGAMASGVSWQSGSLLGSHMSFNIFGWFGTAIVGTLHTLIPSLSGTRLRYPRLEGPTFICWIAGVTVLGSSFAFGLDALTALGWALLLAASVTLAVNLVSSFAAAQRPWNLSLLLIAAGQVFLVQGFVISLGIDLGENAIGLVAGQAREVLPVLFLAGWVGMTVAGSLLHLLSMLARVRSGFAFPIPVPVPVDDLLITMLAVVGLSLMAIAGVIEQAGLTQGARLTLLAALLLLCRRMTGIIRVAFSPGGRVSPSGSPRGRSR